MSSLLSGNRIAGKRIPMADREFFNLRDFIYQDTGIYIDDTRKYLLENRLRNRLASLQLGDYSEYLRYLQYDPRRKDELSSLYEVITTNETSFYRNPPQLKIFQDIVLKNFIEKQRKTEKRIRIWSAGCSTGDEAYTIAMQLHELLGPAIKGWDIKITANDLSQAVIEKAKKGIYNSYALRTTPPALIKKYFIKNKDSFHIRSEVQKIVSFCQLNLSNVLEVRRVERSHIIFCRNVIIYFDETMKKKVINLLYDNLLPGGSLFIGHSESLHSISRLFKPVSHKGTVVYVKEDS